MSGNDKAGPELKELLREKTLDLNFIFSMALQSQEMKAWL